MQWIELNTAAGEILFVTKARLQEFIFIPYRETETTEHEEESNCHTSTRVEVLAMPKEH